MPPEFADGFRRHLGFAPLTPSGRETGGLWSFARQQAPTQPRSVVEPRHATQLRVGLVGWLLRGNFGDDLMAVMFALDLQRAGYEVVVWGLSPAVANAFTITTVDTIAALQSCDALIYAGGGLLTAAHTRMEEEDGFGGCMRQLCALSLNKELPLLLLSIGGDGQAPERAALSETQRLMLRTAKLITVRNLQDVALVKSVSTLPAIACFADVVWRVKLTLGLTRAVGPRSDVLVHQCDGRTRRLIGALVTSSNALGNRIGTVFKFSTQFDPAVINQPRSLQHRDIISTLTTLSTASLLVTPRLHLAISAMTLGTPVLSINVEPKTRLMLETVPELAAVLDAPVGRMRFALWLWRAIRKHESFTVSAETSEALAESASGHVQSALVFLSRREARCVQPSMVRHRLYSTPPRSVVERPYPVNARSGLEGSPPRVQKPQRSCVDQTRWDNP